MGGREGAPASRTGETSTRQALGSVTRVQVTVCFFKFLNSSFKLLQKGVRKQHLSFNAPSANKQTTNKQTKTPNRKTQNRLKGGTEFGKMHLFWLLQVECDSCSQASTQSTMAAARNGEPGVGCRTGYKGSKTTTGQQDMRGAQSDSPVLVLNEEWFKSKTLLQLISSCNKTNPAGPRMYKTS